MKISQDLRPVTALKRSAAELVEEVNREQRPLVITQNGKARAVLLDVQTWERLNDQLGMLELLNQGLVDASAGKVKDQRQVFSDLRKRLQRRHAQ